MSIWTISRPMADRPLGKTEKLFLALFGGGFLLLFGGFVFIVATIAKG